MYQVILVNPPFAAVSSPSIALTQLKATVDDLSDPNVSVRVLYVNQDFAKYLGIELYQEMSSLASSMCGLGDWFFRPYAFPALTDNERPYFTRYFRDTTSTIAAKRQLIAGKRQQAGALVEQLIDRYHLADNDLVGFSSMFSQNLAAFALAKALKYRNPRLTTAIGGANCESPMGQVIAAHVPDIDFVFSGSALKTFPALIGHLSNGNEEACHALNGVFSRHNTARGADGSVTATVAPIGDEVSIDHKLELDYNEFLDRLHGRFGASVEPRLYFETSRGCWWGEKAHCTFCGLNGQTMKARTMSPENALRQFESLFTYADRCDSMHAVDNIMPREYLREVWPRLHPPESVRLFYEVKADLKPEELQVLAAANVKEIQPGIEALATSTLKLMKKGTSSFQNVLFLKNCGLTGITPLWNLLVGFPGELEQVYIKYIRDLPLLVHLPPPTGVYPVRFDRFSPYFTRAKDYGLDLESSDWYTYLYPFDRLLLSQLAYYFTDQNFDAAYLENMAIHLKEMRRLVERWCAQWASEANRPQLTIEQTGGGNHAIVDSRFDVPLEYPLEDSELETLRHLAQPRWVAEVEKSVGVATLEWLRERGLIFEEEGRALALPYDLG